MFRKLVVGLMMVVAAIALSSAALAPNQDVRALPVCVQETVTGVVNANVGPFCVPYGSGVNCQEILIGFLPTIDTRTWVCVPRP